MASSRRSFQVIEGGTGGGVGSTYIDTGVVDEKGRPMLRQVPPSPPTGGDGGGSMTSIFKVDVHRDVQWMRVLWALLLPALASFLFYFVGEMKDVRKDVAGVDKAISVQGATVQRIDTTLGRIEQKLDGAKAPTEGRSSK